MVAALLLVLPASGCMALAAPEAGGLAGRPGADLVPLIATDEREPAPAVSGRTLADEPLALTAFRGTPTVVNFWASWCGPCAREVPELLAVAAAYGEEVAVVGVNVKDSAANARSFERDQMVTYPSFFDPSAIIAAEFGGIAPEALPSTIVLDREHRVAVRLFGAVTGPQLRSYLDQLLAE